MIQSWELDYIEDLWRAEIMAYLSILEEFRANNFYILGRNANFEML